MSSSATNTQKKETKEQIEFRAHCQTWLKDNTPAIPDFRMPKIGIEIMTQEQIDYCAAWNKAAYEAGLIGCDYPVEFGGGGKEGCQAIANFEMKRAKTPILHNPIGLGMGAPTVFYHGSDALKKQLLPKLFSGEEVWCQGFSEPGTGSDLASAQTFAEKKGAKWIINGHKVWTSCAHYASWMILLARTDKKEKHDGLSYFVVPIKSALGKGVTVRPLIKITGETGFNEVIFENLEIDDFYRLDEVGAGWKVAMTTLAHERGAGVFVTPESGGQARKGDDALEPNITREHPLVSLAKNCIRNGKPVYEDPIMADKIMQAVIRATGIKQQRRIRRVKGLVENPERYALQDKLIGSAYVQDMSELALELEGAKSTLYVGDDKAPDGGKWPLEFMSSFGLTIAGGTNEIQKNILGERVLGLPKTK